MVDPMTKGLTMERCRGHIDGVDLMAHKTSNEKYYMERTFYVGWILGMPKIKDEFEAIWLIY